MQPDVDAGPSGPALEVDEHLAGPPAGGAGGRWLVCRAGSLLCALPLGRVVETMRLGPVQGLAGTPDHVLGISVVRGLAVPVVDLGRLVDGPGAAPPKRLVLLRAPVDGGDRLAGAAVAAVPGVVDLPAWASSELDPLLAIDGAAVAGVEVLDGRTTLMLDAARVVPEAVWRRLAGELS
jgi:purine-binding chemotaxis protein CheW